jgi:hypothetical protein
VHFLLLVSQTHFLFATTAFSERNDSESYAGGSVDTLMASLGGQVKGDDTDQQGVTARG